MGKFFDEIPDYLIPWIKRQKMFWVASAPLNPNGHVNLSPKGFDGTFHIENSKRVWYEDMTGSGVETISHLRENGRITILLCAFEGPPRICRLFGKGTVYEFDTPEYNALILPEKRQAGSRSVIMVDIHQVGTSCGFAIPFYTFKSYRMQLHKIAAMHEDADNAAEEQAASCDVTSNPPLPLPEKGLKLYWREKNSKSLDGLPGLTSAYESKVHFSRVDPKLLRSQDGTSEGAQKPRPYSVLAGWVNPQTVTAFTLGVFASTTILKVLQK